MTPRSASPNARASTTHRAARGALCSSLAALTLTLSACVEERVIYNRPFLGGLPGSQTGDVVTPPAGMLESSQNASAQRIKIDNDDGSVTLHSRTARHLMIHIHNLLDDRPVAKSAQAERAARIAQTAAAKTATPQPDAEERPAQQAPSTTATTSSSRRDTTPLGPNSNPGANQPRDRGTFQTIAATPAKAPTNEQIFTAQILSSITADEFFANGKQPEEAYKWLRDARDDIDELFALMPLGESTPGMYLKRIGANVYRLEVPPEARKGLKFHGMDIVMEKGNWRLRWFVQ